MRSILGVVGVCVLGTGALAQPSDDGRTKLTPADDRSVGIEAGVPRLPDTYRSRVVRGWNEEVPRPDVLVLTDGTEIEAYFLQAYRQRVVYYEKESQRSWIRAELPRSRIALVRYGEYLDKDPAGPVIRVARKQPTAKRNVLAGSFTGHQDDDTVWTMTFHSESHKPAARGEDAVEYGTFVLKSRRVQPDGSYEGTSWSAGEYALFAPNSVRNNEWVLTVSEVAHNERDRTDHASFFTSSLPDDAFIVRFSPRRDSFRLLWSNLSSGAWTSLPQIEFRHTETTPPQRTPYEPVRRTIKPRERVRLQPVAAPPRTRLGGRVEGWSRPRTRMIRW